MSLIPVQPPVQGRTATNSDYVQHTWRERMQKAATCMYVAGLWQHLGYAQSARGERIIARSWLTLPEQEAMS